MWLLEPPEAKYGVCLGGGDRQPCVRRMRGRIPISSIVPAELMSIKIRWAKWGGERPFRHDCEGSMHSDAEWLLALNGCNCSAALAVVNSIDDAPH